MTATNDLDNLPAGAVYDRRRRVEIRARLLLHETEAVVRLFGPLTDRASTPHLLASFDRLADALATWRAAPRCRRAEEAAFRYAVRMREAWRWEREPYPRLNTPYSPNSPMEACGAAGEGLRGWAG
ncbi:MAG: hypothetical protein ACREKN_06935 [Longimicrobiaceae bacterium]